MDLSNITPVTRDLQNMMLHVRVVPLVHQYNLTVRMLTPLFKQERQPQFYLASHLLTQERYHQFILVSHLLTQERYHQSNLTPHLLTQERYHQFNIERNLLDLPPTLPNHLSDLPTNQIKEKTRDTKFLSFSRTFSRNGSTVTPT